MSINSVSVVINTGPLIGLAAATGGWQVLQAIPKQWITTDRVIAELEAGRVGSPGRGLAVQSPWLEIRNEPTAIPAYLLAGLDAGEASVIGLALSERIPLVAIDEQAGRAVARTCGIRVTGSLGILMMAQAHGYPVNLSECMDRMRAAGIWVSQVLAQTVLNLQDKNRREP